MCLIIKTLIMDSEEHKIINLSILVLSFKIKALQDSLTDDQKKIFETSLEKSKVMIRSKFQIPSVQLNLIGCLMLWMLFNHYS